VAFADLTVKLKGDITDFANKMGDALKQANKFSSKLGSGVTSKSTGWVEKATSLKDKYREATKELTAHNLGLKDTSRIIQGIMISQMFYGAVQSIRSAASALWDFNVALDYMKVTYSALFGSTKVAEDFMSVLQEHSIETIFDYQGLADASKKLLAYGIEYENLMFIMEGLTNLGAMSGDSAALDRIALALGQIYTKGKLSAEEMRQLANAYIPITDILQDKFGLTGDQLKRVSDLNLPAADVINAIVDYANENFGGVGDAAMMTITGLQNRIVDTVKVVGASMMQPLTTAYKSFLAYVSKGLESLRSAYSSGGAGGVFEYLVPDESTQQIIRQFLANVHNLFNAVATVATVAGKVFGNFAIVVANAFNTLSPIIVGFTNLLAVVIDAFLSTSFGATTLRIALIGAAAAFVLLKAQAIGALVITAVTKAVQGLSKALVVLGAVISKHPIVALLVGLAAVLLGVSVSSSKANSSISGLFDTLSGAGGGTSSDEVLQKVNQTLTDSADAADQFNNRLKGSADAAKDLSNAISGAGKEAKKTSGLLSFDEVFKLPEQANAAGSSGTGSGGLLGDLENLAAGFGNLGESLIPEIPDFSEYVSKYVDGLFGGLEEGIKEKVTGSAVPGGTGFFAGAAMVLSKYFTSSGGTSLGSVIANAFKTGGLKGVWTALSTGIKSTGLKAILKGGVIGMAVSLVVDGLANLLWSSLEEKFSGANAETASIGQTIGSLLGGIIGGIIGGPAGVLIGSGIGTFVGGFIGLFEDEIGKFLSDELGINWGTAIGAAIGAAWGPIGAAISAKLGTDLSDFFTTNKEDITIWASETGSKLSTWWEETKTGFTTWWENTSSGFTTWLEDTKLGFGTWRDNTVAIFSDWGTINSDTLDLWWADTKAGFNTWKEDTFGKLDTWWTDTTSGFSTWWTNTTTGFSSWASDTGSKISTWYNNTKSGLGTWSGETKKGLTDWWTSTKSGFNTWKTENEAVIGGFLLAAALKFDAWFTDTKEDVKNGWNALWDPKAWKSGWDSVKSWFSDLWTSISTWFTNIGKSISSWWDGLWDDKEVSVNTSSSGSGSRATLSGHAAGGVFNREHIARFAEGNKAEAIIPLENRSAMQPFVDAVSNGIVSSLAPIVATVNAGSQSNLPPLYVGTLIADDRGLKELYKKFEVIQLQENDRRGLNAKA
jgi:tape measure domain-containing protein